MTSLVSEVKALEERVEKAESKAALLDQVQALLAGPVQLPMLPMTAGGVDIALERNKRAAAEELADNLRALLAQSQAEVKRLTEQVAETAKASASAALKVIDDRNARIAELEAHVETLRRDAASAVTKAVTETEDAEAARTQDKLLTDVARALGVEQLEDASGNESGDPLDFTSDAITSTILHHLTDPLHEVLQRLQAAGRIDLPEDELRPVAAVRVVEEAIAGLIEDLECATDREPPKPAAKPMDVERLDAMIADVRGLQWDLSAFDRAVLTRLRALVAPPPTVSREFLLPDTPLVREALGVSDVSIPKVNTEAKPYETVAGCKHLEVSSVFREGHLAERVCRGCGALMTMAYVVTRLNTRPTKRRMFLLATAQPPGWLEEHETCTRFATEAEAEAAKPRGSRVIALADVPALLAKDAAPQVPPSPSSDGAPDPSEGATPADSAPMESSSSAAEASPSVDAATAGEAKPKKKRSKKKAKEPETPPPEAFTGTGYVITKVTNDVRMYVMPGASLDHPHSVWTVAKAGARVFLNYTEAADEKKRLKLKLGEPIPIEMIEDKYGVGAEMGQSPEQWSEKRRGYLEEADADGTIGGWEVTELAARRAEESEPA